jgi:hypothetical protein
MKTIPETENALVLRTDFSDQKAWEQICAIIRKPSGLFRFRAYVDFLADEQYSGISKAQVLKLLPQNYHHSFIMIVDQITISHAEHPLLIVDLFDEGMGNEFRALPTQIHSIENNLSIANMDFEEFAGSVDGNGIFRGFPRM